MAFEFTDSNFQEKALGNDGLKVVDFWAEWCGPCKIMGPVVEELAHELDASKIKIGKMNVDQNQMPGQFNIMSIPTFLVFKDGKVADQIVGSMPKEALKARLEKYLA